MRGKVKLGGALAAMALVLLMLGQAAGFGLLAVTAQQESSQGSSVSDMAAAAYVHRVYKFVNLTLRVAERFNVTIPENLRVVVNETIELLNQARVELGNNTTKAVMLATQASLMFGNVADYVWSHLPSDVKKELEIRGMEKVIEVRMNQLEKIKEKILRIENLTGANMTPILEKINETKQLLQQAMQDLNQSNITAAKRKIIQATNMLMREIRLATISSYKVVYKTAALGAVTLAAVKHTEKLATAVNRTVTMLSQNETPENLTDIITSLIERNTALEHRIEKLLDRIPEDYNNSFVQALMILQEGLNTTQIYLNASLTAAMQNQTDWVVANLTMALESLNETLQQVYALGLPGSVREIVHRGMDIVKHMHKMEMRAEAKYYAAISVMLDKKMHMLEKAYEKYQNGDMPKWRYKALLVNERMRLVILKERLGSGVPPWLLAKIDGMINWIDSHMP